MNTNELWTVVDKQTREPIVPFDCNPDSDDEGFLVYRSREAAESSAKHQNEMYYLDCEACRLDLVLPVTATAKTQPAAENKSVATFDLDQSGDGDVEKALAMAEEIQELAEELPDAGFDYGVSVSEKASDIAANIEERGRVTDNQFTALENMLDGLRRWFHD